MFRSAVLFFGIMAFVCGHLTDDEGEEMHKLIFSVAKKCADDLGISEEDFETAKKTNDPTDIDPCFWACMFKENGLIDGEGMYDNDASFAFASKFVKNDESLEQIKKMSDACLPVNEKEVSDGAKGCERSQLLAKCFMENRSAIEKLKV